MNKYVYVLSYTMTYLPCFFYPLILVIMSDELCKIDLAIKFLFYQK